MNVSTVKFGIFDDFVPDIKKVKPTCVFPINSQQFLATTNKGIYRFNSYEIREIYPFKCTTAVFIPELDVVIGNPINTSLLIAFMLYNDDQEKPVLQPFETNHAGICYLIYSPKSHSLLTIGDGIRVWSLTSTKWTNVRSSIPPQMKIRFRSSFGSFLTTSLLNTPVFDYDNELIYLPTDRGIKPFDLDGRPKQAVSLFPCVTYDRYNTVQEAQVRTSVYAIRKEMKHGIMQQTVVTSDPHNGMIVWTRMAQILKRITTASSCIIMMSLLDLENVIFMDNSGTLYILNIRTERVFQCYNLQRLPHRIYIMEQGETKRIALCFDMSITILRIFIPWEVWAPNITSAKSIIRCDKFNEAARVMCVTSNSFIKVFSPKDGSLMIAATPTTPSSPISSFYDRGLWIKTTFNQQTNSDNYEINEIADKRTRDQIFSILEDGTVVGFSTNSAVSDELFNLKIRAKFMVICEYQQQPYFAFVCNESDIVIYEYKTMQIMKRFTYLRESIKGLFYNQTTKCLILIYAQKIALFDIEKGLPTSTVKIKTSSVSAAHNDDILIGYSNGYLGHVKVVENNLVIVCEEGAQRPHQDKITNISFGKSFWLSCSLDCAVHVWDYNMLIISTIIMPVPIYSCCVLNGYRDVLLATDGEIMRVRGSLVFNECDNEIEEIDNYDKLKDLFNCSDGVIMTEDEEKEELLLSTIKSKDETNNISLSTDYINEMKKEEAKKELSPNDRHKLLAEMQNIRYDPIPVKTEYPKEKEAKEIVSKEYQAEPKKKKIIRELSAKEILALDNVPVKPTRKKKKKKRKQQIVEAQSTESASDVSDLSDSDDQFAGMPLGRQKKDEYDYSAPLPKRIKVEKEKESDEYDYDEDCEDDEQQEKRKKAKKKVTKISEPNSSRKEMKSPRRNALIKSMSRDTYKEHQDKKKETQEILTGSVKEKKQSPVRKSKPPSVKSITKEKDNKTKSDTHQITPREPKSPKETPARRSKAESLQNKEQVKKKVIKEKKETPKKKSPKNTSEILEMKPINEIKEVPEQTVIDDNKEEESVKNETTEEESIGNEPKAISEITKEDIELSESAEEDSTLNQTTKVQEKQAINETKEEKKAINETKEEKKAINETKEEKKVTNETKEEKKAINETKEEKQVINETKEEKQVINETKEEKKIINETKEEKKIINETKEISAKKSIIKNKEEKIYTEKEQKAATISKFQRTTEPQPKQKKISDPKVIPRQEKKQFPQTPVRTNKEQNNSPETDLLLKEVKQKLQTAIQQNPNKAQNTVDQKPQHNIQTRKQINVPKYTPPKAVVSSIPKYTSLQTQTVPLKERLKHSIDKVDPQMSKLLGYDHTATFNRVRPPTPPPIRWGNQLIPQSLFSPVPKRYDDSDLDTRANFRIPPPNIVIDPTNVLIEYGKGWKELKPLIDLLQKEKQLQDQFDDTINVSGTLKLGSLDVFSYFIPEKTRQRYMKMTKSAKESVVPFITESHRGFSLPKRAVITQESAKQLSSKYDEYEKQLKQQIERRKEHSRKMFARYMPYWADLVEETKDWKINSPLAEEVRNLLLVQKTEFDKQKEVNPLYFYPSDTVSFVREKASESVRVFMTESSEFKFKTKKGSQTLKRRSKINTPKNKILSKSYQTLKLPTLKTKRVPIKQHKISEAFESPIKITPLNLSLRRTGEK